MSEELSAGDAASIYFFFSRFKHDEAGTCELMIRFKSDNDTEEQITTACKLFFADVDRHTARAIAYEQQKQVEAEMKRTQIAAILDLAAKGSR